jgi:hypothetical protein
VCMGVCVCVSVPRLGLVRAPTMRRSARAARWRDWGGRGRGSLCTSPRVWLHPARGTRHVAGVRVRVCLRVCVCASLEQSVQAVIGERLLRGRPVLAAPAQQRKVRHRLYDTVRQRQYGRHMMRVYDTACTAARRGAALALPAAPCSTLLSPAFLPAQPPAPSSPAPGPPCRGRQGGIRHPASGAATSSRAPGQVREGEDVRRVCGQGVETGRAG